MERGCGVKNIVEWRVRLDSLFRCVNTQTGSCNEQIISHLIKCSILGHILDDHIGELLLRRVGVVLKDSFALVIGAHCKYSIKPNASRSVSRS